MNEKKYITEGSGRGTTEGIQTTCANMDCPHREKCRVNIWKDGIPCPHYQSQQQHIYSSYLTDCEKKGEKPMPRGVYFEF